MGSLASVSTPSLIPKHEEAQAHLKLLQMKFAFQGP